MRWHCRCGTCRECRRVSTDRLGWGVLYGLVALVGVLKVIAIWVAP